MKNYGDIFIWKQRKVGMGVLELVIRSRESRTYYLVKIFDFGPQNYPWSKLI